MNTQSDSNANYFRLLLSCHYQSVAYKPYHGNLLARIMPEYIIYHLAPPRKLPARVKICKKALYRSVFIVMRSVRPTATSKNK